MTPACAPYFLCQERHRRGGNGSQRLHIRPGRTQPRRQGGEKHIGGGPWIAAHDNHRLRFRSLPQRGCQLPSQGQQPFTGQAGAPSPRR